MGNNAFYGLTGEVVTPESPNYNEASQEWNRTIQKYPRAIVCRQEKYDPCNVFCFPQCIRP